MDLLVNSGQFGILSQGLTSKVDVLLHSPMAVVGDGAPFICICKSFGCMSMFCTDVDHYRTIHLIMPSSGYWTGVANNPQDM